MSFDKNFWGEIQARKFDRTGPLIETIKVSGGECFMPCQITFLNIFFNKAHIFLRF